MTSFGIFVIQEVSILSCGVISWGVQPDLILSCYSQDSLLFGLINCDVVIQLMLSLCITLLRKCRSLKQFTGELIVSQ
jgi:hypothetical protein